MKRLLSSLLILFSLHINSSYATLKIGTPHFRPPFIISPIEGFDIDLIRTICQRMKEKCQIFPMQFDELYGALDTGYIDLAIGAITDSEARRAHYLFSLPYMMSQAQFLVLKDKGFKSVKDLEGKKVGTIRGSDFEDFLANNCNDLFHLTLFKEPIIMINSLNEGNIAAAFLESASMNYWQQESGGTMIEIGKPFTIGRGFAIMSIPKKAILIQKINQQLMQMEKDGTYVQLYKKYF